MLTILKLLFLLPLAIALEYWPTAQFIAPSFINTDVVRNVELGQVVQVTTTYSIKSLGDVDNSVYYVTMSKEEDDVTSSIEAKLRGVQGTLEVRRLGQHFESLAYLYSVTLSRPLASNQTATLIVNTVETHATYPKPAYAKQDDPHYRAYETDAILSSPYETTSQRLKIKCPTPNIRSHSVPPSLESLAKDAPATQSGPVITYGPFQSQAPTAVKEYDYAARKIAVEFELNLPVLTVASLKRAAEVSHWGANLNIQDDYVLRNDGPILKGQFSRLEYMHLGMYRKTSSVIIPQIAMELPPGAHSVYYVDEIGNVSTSAFRPARSPGQFSTRIQPFSSLDLRPRYPLLGGWNYTFTVGWDSPLEDSVHWDKENDRWILAVPFMTPMSGAAVDEAQVKVILPEGAKDITVHPPFDPFLMERSTHITYLDSIGRPAITFHGKKLCEKHDGIIYVTYRMPLLAHFQKPFTVATAVLIVFSAAWALRRVDMSIKK